jgi:type IV pilus assembly protein PilX
MMNHRTVHQRGTALFLVMILLIVMTLGAMGMARIVEASTGSSGNQAFREASLHASEVGINAAFTALRAIPAGDEDTNQGQWYSAVNRPTDASGLPIVNWNLLPEITVGAYRVRYAVDRACTVTPVTQALHECLIRQVHTLTSARDADDKLEPPNSRQYRITVQVIGPKDTTTFVQTLVTKG